MAGIESRRHIVFSRKGPRSISLPPAFAVKIRRLAAAHLALVLIALLLPACAETIRSEAYKTARSNQERINRLRLGQTLTEVEKIMGHGPERRSTRLRFDGLSIEEWGYVSDPLRQQDTLITFVGGKVNEIRTVPWKENSEKD